jgi:hypothetical protein
MSKNFNPLNVKVSISPNRLQRVFFRNSRLFPIQIFHHQILKASK